MKKIIFTLFIAALLCGPLTAKDNKKKDNSAEWKEVGDQGKKALKETGNFFKDLGKKIGDGAKEAANDVKEAAESANEVKCIGKWGFNKNTTTIEVKSNGKIEIRQKQGSDTYFWKGTYTSTLKMLTITVESEGTSSWTVSNETKSDGPKKMRLTYSTIKDDDNAMKFSSTDIPDDTEGNSFASAKIFTKM